jgi:hypothetical protein
MSSVCDEQGIIYLTNVRVSFPHLLTAHVPPATPDAEPKFMSDFILAPDNPGYEAFRARIWELINNKPEWKEIAPQIFAQIEGDRKLRNYGSGSEKLDKKTMKVLNGYEGNNWIMANNKFQPQVVDENGVVIDSTNTMAVQAALQKIYGGCYVNVAIRPWLQDNSFGRAARCDLVGIQFLKDGEPFGVGTPNIEGGFNKVEGAPAPVGSVPGDTPAVGAAPGTVPPANFT